ncbi:DUF1269 domain-containing protein [Pontibacter sp. G13]|uniref:DUF1269 domain-containing protein n=1 Tax=Pontibacter sp. G13 TaxID=3074898 RepID=UPI00288991C0|nr:DUF1269 domain-containing protein [Pontibacter sp. G13]WNJ19526.1 DUF1269 domain-containing protein [Pontibacter sp. G13]
MSTLVAIAFDNELGANGALNKLQKLQKEYLVDLEDAVIATHLENGKVKLHQSFNLVKEGAIGSAWWGGLIGLLFGGGLGLVIGGAAAAGLGAIGGSMVDYGINDQFMKDLAAKMTPGSSALFILLRSATMDKVEDELNGVGGTLLQTSLSKEDEARLQAALSGNRSSDDQPEG